MRSGNTIDYAERHRPFICFLIAMSAVLLPLLSKAEASPKISVRPAAVNLGLIKAGSVSAPRNITIMNTGSSDLVIDSIEVSGANASEFGYTPSAACSGPVPAKGSCQVSVTLTPQTPFGRKGAMIKISSNDPKKPTVVVKLMGQAPPPKISVSPMAVNFPAAAAGGTTTPRAVTVTNTGLSDLAITGVSITGANSNDFSQTNNCSSIGKGGSCTIEIAFSPSVAAGRENAGLSISSNDPKKGLVNVKLKGQSNGGAGPTASGINVMAVSVNGSLCSANSYINKPCVSLTVCTPGTATCQTINDVLLDTGSFGLRIFKQALSVPLTPENIGSSGELAECVQYGDGSSNWGPVQIAGIILGDEPAVQVPIQVIDSTYGALPPGCQNADKSPQEAGFNGILGVGLFAQDCGQGCAASSDNGMYYVCNGTDCQGTAVPLSSQVQNPVALLPDDNNGVIVQFPAVPGGGAFSVDGYLVLGIGTRANNMPSGVTTYVADQYGEFVTQFKGVSYKSFIDTGSNGLFFPSVSSSMMPDCPSPNAAWYCPSSTLDFSAVNTGASGTPSASTSFQIGNFNKLLVTPNNVFAEIGGDGPGSFDWGLPFYFGRSVYVGLEGMRSSLGRGTYWAY